MTDLSKTIIPKSDQLNADDLIAGSITIKITKLALLAGEQPLSISYEGDNGKPWKPCKSMRRVLVSIWGSDGAAYIGHSITLYRDEKVTFGAMAVGGIRISHMSHIDKPVTLALTASRASRKPFIVQPLVTQEDDIERIKEIGRSEADKGADALKQWWGSLGGARHKQLGVDYLNEVKSIAAQVDTLSEDENISFLDRVNNMICRIEMDIEQLGTQYYENVLGSYDLKLLLQELENSQEQELLEKINKSIIRKE